MKKRTTRRDFLTFIALGVTGGSLIGGSGLFGYLVFDYLSQRRVTASPSTAPPRPTLGAQPAVPPIILREEWGALPPDHTAANETGRYSLENPEGWRVYEGDLRDIYRTVVIHHSVIYEGDDVTTMREIQTRHMTERGWADIGYHFAVGKTGVIFEGRELAVRGTHVARYNTGSAGVVFLGNFEEESPSLVQLEAGRRLVDWLTWRLDLTHLASHHAFNDITKCPGAHMVAHLEGLAQSAGLLVGTEGYEPPPEQLITPAADDATAPL